MIITIKNQKKKKFKTISLELFNVYQILHLEIFRRMTLYTSYHIEIDRLIGIKLNLERLRHGNTRINLLDQIKDNNS